MRRRQHFLIKGSNSKAIAAPVTAAVVAPAAARDAALILRARNGQIVALRYESEMPVALLDGQRWRLGDTTWTVAVHGPPRAAPAR